MVKLDEKSANRLAKLFVDVYEGGGTKRDLSTLNHTLFKIQQSWIGTH
jgi:hypothetical protein